MDVTIAAARVESAVERIVLSYSTRIASQLRRLERSIARFDLGTHLRRYFDNARVSAACGQKQRSGQKKLDAYVLPLPFAASLDGYIGARIACEP